MRQINELMFYFQLLSNIQNLKYTSEADLENPTPLHFMMKYNIIKDYAIHTA